LPQLHHDARPQRAAPDDEDRHSQDDQSGQQRRRALGNRPPDEQAGGEHPAQVQNPVAQNSLCHPERSEGSLSRVNEILRFAQNDTRSERRE